MKTITSPNPSNRRGEKTPPAEGLQIMQESFIGLQFAHRITQGILRRLSGSVPFKFRMGATASSQVYEFRGNNLKVTITVEKE